MDIQHFSQGNRKTILDSGKVGKFDFGIRLFSEKMDIRTVVDLAVVYKSKRKGLTTIWYGNTQDESGFIVDDTINCQGSNWKDDDMRFTIDFAQVKDVERISIITNILWGKDLHQHLGLVERGFLHIYSHDKKEDILQQDIQWQSHAGKTGLIWSEVYQFKDQWKIKAIEESCVCKDLGQLAQIAGGYL